MNYTLSSEITRQDGRARRLPRNQQEYELLQLLTNLYGDGMGDELASRLLQIAENVDLPPPRGTALSADQVLLITYGDTISEPGQPPLATLKTFADAHLEQAFSGIHVLPFYPYTSDDGFAVCDYGAVREDLGTWEDVAHLAERFDLMFDLVINHCSREHLWFADFIGGRVPGKDFFIEVPADTELGAVVRPRNTPLLSPVQTYGGTRHVWTTFSDDQVDLNFANPEVLSAFVEILFDYVERGARYVRLDAIAFLWKRVGTSCMSLPETHMVVKIMRLLLDISGADARLLTETNVPHAENISYFGARDEAHMVYQFSLAPLLLYAYLFQDGSYLQNWARTLDEPPPGCAYLNFIASHDGIGLRPLEGLVPDEDVTSLIELVHDRGGFVSMRSTADGGERAYELNIALFSAFGGDAADVPAFIGAHQLLCAFQGVPAIYINALLGRANDLGEVEHTGRTRSINRGKLRLAEVIERLDDPALSEGQAFEGLTHSLALRRRQSAFSPEARQVVLSTPASYLALLRESETQRILVIASFLPTAQRVSIDELMGGQALDGAPCDILTGAWHDAAEPLHLAPYQVVWLDLDRRQD